MNKKREKSFVNKDSRANTQNNPKHILEQEERAAGISRFSGASLVLLFWCDVGEDGACVIQRCPVVYRIGASARLGFHVFVLVSFGFSSCCE